WQSSSNTYVAMVLASSRSASLHAHQRCRRLSPISGCLYGSGSLKLQMNVPKERTKGPNKDERGRQRKRPGVDNRERDSRGQIREKRGDTRIDTLRRTYGDSF